MPQEKAVAVELSQGWSRLTVVGVVVLLPLAALLGACGSSSSSSSATVARTCKQVEAVLSDGPDPEADPVGHAQAQILPLRQIRTSEGTLRRAIATLASAYEAFSSSNGASQATHAVASASKAIDVICPEAAS